MNWHVTHCGYITDDTLHHVHGLWSAKSTESCVGWKVCLANITNGSEFGNVVSILTVHDSFFHYLRGRLYDMKDKTWYGHLTVSERSVEFPALE